MPIPRLKWKCEKHNSRCQEIITVIWFAIYFHWWWWIGWIQIVLHNVSSVTFCRWTHHRTLIKFLWDTHFTHALPCGRWDKLYFLTVFEWKYLKNKFSLKVWTLRSSFLTGLLIALWILFFLLLFQFDLSPKVSKVFEKRKITFIR